ncbi:hypothetical protein HHI36_007428 [Cryptolaemus montrouzieri]|uniref:Uncharacterized protein n=1 Tax=Cryptolaemus montrouzieri TaxID=559131 RepID=A0ABD2MPY7_9CUCU
MEKQPDEPEDFTNEPLPSMSEPMGVQDAVAPTSATPCAQTIIAASKSKAQKQQYIENAEEITEEFINLLQGHIEVCTRTMRISNKQRKKQLDNTKFGQSNS